MYISHCRASLTMRDTSGGLVCCCRPLPSPARHAAAALISGYANNCGFSFSAWPPLPPSAPQSPQLQGFQEVERPTAILEEHHEVRGDGNFNYGYQSENGIVVEVSGEPGEQGQNRVKGMYRFPLPNGTIAEVTYTADEGGFKANSPLLPPVPQHAKEQIIIAKQQEAQGIVFE
ncbi:hypothetical protein O3P69_013678 [Scylla paramamosain]|uniref:Uncharacterized protein n=1 Tax=Scylla paramamosain TaxID=85552 RepID=A0AAW0SPA4_SCYPA